MNKPWSRSLVAAAFGVVVWRSVTFIQLASGRMEGVVEDPFGLVLLRGLMGLLFVACGLMVARSELPWARAFGWYGVTYGLHWGGPIVVGIETAAPTAVFLLYLLVSGALAHSCLLLWFSSYPSREAPVWLRRAVLVPPGLALLAGGLGLTSGATAALGVAQSILGIWPTLATVLALVVLSVAALRQRATRGQRLRLVGLYLAAIAPWQIATALGRGDLAGWWTLLFLAPTIAMVIEVHRSDPRSVAGGGNPRTISRPPSREGRADIVPP